MCKCEFVEISFPSASKMCKTFPFLAGQFFFQLSVVMKAGFLSNFILSTVIETIVNVALILV
jgi:hypothetical protein